MKHARFLWIIAQGQKFDYLSQLIHYGLQANDVWLNSVEQGSLRKPFKGFEHLSLPF